MLQQAILHAEMCWGRSGPCLAGRLPRRCACCLPPLLASRSPWPAPAAVRCPDLPRHLPLTAAHVCGPTTCSTTLPLPHAPQRYFGTAVGKGRQGAKNEIEKLKLEEMSCREGIQAVAKM